MAFADTIRQIPYAPAGNQAVGFLPPILRSMSHILYLTGCLADENVNVENQEALNELNEALTHWIDRAPSSATSTAINEKLRLVGEAISEALNEYIGWNDEQRTQNLRDLANRVVAVSCDLDRELLGLTGSNPGSSL